MPTKPTSLSAEQVQLLCQVVQHSESPKKESWDIIAQKLDIANGNAAQQRFGRLLKTLKSANPSDSSGGGKLNAKAAGKRAAPGKANGKSLKRTKASAKCSENGEEGREENQEGVDDEDGTAGTKQKTKAQHGAPKWKPIFGSYGDAIKTEDKESESDAATSKAEED